MKYRPDRNWWEVYIPPNTSKELDLYRYCIEAFGPPGLSLGWDQVGGSYRFTKEEYVTIVKLRFGL